MKLWKTSLVEHSSSNPGEELISTTTETCWCRNYVKVDMAQKEKWYNVTIFNCRHGRFYTCKRPCPNSTPTFFRVHLLSLPSSPWVPFCSSFDFDYRHTICNERLTYSSNAVRNKDRYLLPVPPFLSPLETKNWHELLKASWTSPLLQKEVQICSWSSNELCISHSKYSLQFLFARFSPESIVSWIWSFVAGIYWPYICPAFPTFSIISCR